MSLELLRKRQRWEKERQKRVRPKYVPLPDEMNAEWETGSMGLNTWCDKNNQWSLVRTLSTNDIQFLANADQKFFKGDDHVMNNRSHGVRSTLQPKQWMADQPEASAEIWRSRTIPARVPDLSAFAQKAPWNRDDKIPGPKKLPRPQGQRWQDDWLETASVASLEHDPNNVPLKDNDARSDVSGSQFSRLPPIAK
jgi:hypothetical protein